MPPSITPDAAAAVAAFEAEQQLLQQQRRVPWPWLLTAAIIAALLTGELGGFHGGGAGSAQLHSAAAAAAAATAPPPMRVLEVAMAIAAQERSAELFVIDCFRRPIAAAPLSATADDRAVVCLFEGQGRFRQVFAPDALAWSCAVVGAGGAATATSSAPAAPLIKVPALRSYSTPLLGTTDRGTGGPYPVHIVECACASQFDGEPVFVSVSAFHAMEGRSEFAASACSVLVAPPPLPLSAPALRQPGGVFLAGMLCVSDTFWDTASPPNVQFDGMVMAVTLSVLFHLAVGFEHMTVYFDLRAPEPFLAEFAVTLRPEVARSQVTFVKTRSARAHFDLEFQEM